MKRLVLFAFASLVVLAVPSAAPAQHEHRATAKAPACSAANAFKAIAVLNPTQGNQVSGVVTFTEEGKSVTVVADISGLAPNTKHGFHIHEFGDCSAPDATSAGGHYNPGGHPHAGPPTPMRHAGDFGNLQTDESGKAHLELTLDNITVSCGPASVLGRGLVLHAQEDDLKTQPTGASGARVACGVIGIAKDGVKK